MVGISPNGYGYGYETGAQNSERTMTPRNQSNIRAVSNTNGHLCTLPQTDQNVAKKSSPIFSLSSAPASVPIAIAFSGLPSRVVS